MTFIEPSTAAHAAASPLAHTALRAGALITAARALLPALEAGTTITSAMLRSSKAGNLSEGRLVLEVRATRRALLSRARAGRSSGY